MSDVPNRLGGDFGIGLYWPRFRLTLSRRRRRSWKPPLATFEVAHFEFVVPPSGGVLRVSRRIFRLKAGLQTIASGKVTSIGREPPE